MRAGTIARNYAEALFELGQRHDESESYASAFDVLVALLRSDERVQRFLDTPQIDPAPKQDVLRTALEGRVPERFLRFVLVVLAKRRQRVLPQIRTEYRQILDEAEGRIHAEVMLAHEPDDATVSMIADRLSALLDKDVRPQITVNPAILGGLVVRYGDRAMDGSVRRQLVSLRREMMHAYLPELPAANG